MPVSKHHLQASIDAAGRENLPPLSWIPPLSDALASPHTQHSSSSGFVFRELRPLTERRMYFGPAEVGVRDGGGGLLCSSHAVNRMFCVKDGRVASLPSGLGIKHTLLFGEKHCRLPPSSNQKTTKKANRRRRQTKKVHKGCKYQNLSEVRCFEYSRGKSCENFQ